MLSPSANILNQTVTLLIHTWTVDEEGGRQVATTTTVASVPCGVEPEDPIIHTEGERFTTIIPHRLSFLRDYGLNSFDEITWVEGTRTHNLVVSGVVNALGRGGFFDCLAIERI